MSEERKPYNLSELIDLLEKVRTSNEEITINLPSALMCITNQIINLIIRMQDVEMINEEGLSLIWDERNAKSATPS